jgi:putative transposase
VVINHRLDEYNTIRSLGSLGGMNPKYFLQRWVEGNISQQPETLQSDWTKDLEVANIDLVI